jgi:phage internal scaffolding protein
MKKSIFIRTPYNYDTDEVSNETGLACPEPTMAQQQFREEADINTIMERFGRTGEIIAPVRMPQYGDFTGVNDYHTAMNAVVEAQASFDALPAAVRARFENDPGKFVEFCLDENNREEAVKLGLVSAPAVEPAKPADATFADVAAQ